MKYLTVFSYTAGQETFQNYQKLLGMKKKIFLSAYPNITSERYFSKTQWDLNQLKYFPFSSNQRFYWKHRNLYTQT